MLYGERLYLPRCSTYKLRFYTLLPSIGDAEIRLILVRGGTHEHATFVFITSPNSEPALKRQVVNVYTASLKEVWQVSIAFAVVTIPLAIFIKEMELRTELKTEYGLENETEKNTDLRKLEHGTLISPNTLIVTRVGDGD